MLLVVGELINSTRSRSGRPLPSGMSARSANWRGARLPQERTYSI